MKSQNFLQKDYEKFHLMKNLVFSIEKQFCQKTFAQHSILSLF